MIRKFIWKGAIIEKVNLKDKVERLDLPGNKIYTVIEMRCKDKQIDQWYRINSPERNQLTYGNIIYDRNSIRKDELFNRR